MVVPSSDDSGIPQRPHVAGSHPEDLPPMEPPVIPLSSSPPAGATTSASAHAKAGPDVNVAGQEPSRTTLLDMGAPRSSGPLRRRISTWVGVYGVVLALIAFWPVPVDSGAGGFVRWVTAHIPVLTYSRIEFGSNILLFVPFGIGVALLLPRLRYLVLPAGLLVSLAIESGQGIFLTDRTPSLRDILANVSGAALGLILVVVFEAVRTANPFDGRRSDFDRRHRTERRVD